MADLSDIQAAQTVKIVGSDGTGVEQTPVSTTITNDLQVSPQGSMLTSFYPDPSSIDDGTRTEAKFDSDNNLQVRSAVFTDEGSVRLHFDTGPDIAVTGSVVFVNGSTTVTGSGTAFLSEFTVGDYIYRTTQASSIATQVAALISDTEMVLVEGYLGATSTGSAYKNKFRITTSGSGAIAYVSDNVVHTTSGVGSTFAFRNIDYLPLNAEFQFKIVQAHSTDVTEVGFTASDFSYNNVCIRITGTSTTVFDFVTSGDDGHELVTQVTLKGTESLANFQAFEINVIADTATLVINDTIRAQHKRLMPCPYDVLGFGSRSVSVNAGGAITATRDETLIENYDVVQVVNKSSTPMYVAVVGEILTSAITTGEGFTKGTATISSTTQTSVRKTTYTEQSSNAQRSIASASANDTSAGTGARTVLLTYFTASGTGPYTETLTLNGTTGVNTVATDICYIEKIEVLTVGSSGISAGIITLYAAINKGGAVISTITAGDLSTSYAHHYISSGSTTKISSLFCGNAGDTSGKASRFVLKYKLLGTDSAEKELSEIIRMPGSVGPVYRGLDTPIVVFGPARLTLYVTNESNASYDVFGSFSFTEG